MPTVPQYTREVKPELTPNKYFKPELNTDMFGVNVARAQGNLGNTIGNVGDSLNNVMLGIAARIEDANILGLRNHDSEYCEKNLRDLQNGYLYKTGEDAYGKSEALVKDYEKYMTDYISKSFATPRAKRKAMDTYAGLKDRFIDTVTKHDFEAGIELAKNRAEETKSYTISEANFHRNQPDEYNKILQTGLQAIEYQGEVSHWDANQINAEKRKYLAEATETTLEQYIKDNDLRAAAFFEEHKKRITPQKIPIYTAAIKKNEIDYQSREIAAGFLGLSSEEVYKKLNNIDDLDLRDATEKQWIHQTGQLEKIQKEKLAEFGDQMSNRIADALANGADANDVKRDIMASDLPFELKKKHIEYINACLALGREVSLWNERDSLEKLKRTNYPAFQAADLNKYNLTESERKQYKKEQQEVKEYSTLDQLDDIVEHFDTFFWAGGGLSGKEYRQDIMSVLAMVEQLQGEAFNVKNLDSGFIAAIIEGFNYKAPEMPKELKTFGIKDFKNIDETKELYMRAKAVAEIKENVARDLVNLRYEKKREPEPAEVYAIVQKEYMRVARENNQKAKAAVDKKMTIAEGIKNTNPTKKGYTKALTYFEETMIPQCKEETGVELVVTSTYRADGKYGHEKGIKIDLFPKNPTKENIEKTTEWLLKNPLVAVVFCSNPYVARYDGNTKLQYKQAVNYDNKPETKKAGINHRTHFDITLSTQFGGTQQNIITNKPTYISATK